jgi:hypothetical protein
MDGSRLLLGRRRWRMLAAALCAVGAATATSTTELADVVTLNHGCEWTNGPTTPDTGCTYAPIDFVGSVEWVGGFGPATVSGNVIGTPVCAFLGGVGGACVYEQVPTNPPSAPTSVTVSEPFSTAGTAGVLEPADVSVTVIPPGCAWAPGTGGCSYYEQNSVTGTLIYVNGGPPSLVNAQLGACTAFTATSGECTYSVSTAKVTVTVIAPSLSAGVIVDQPVPKGVA